MGDKTYVVGFLFGSDGKNIVLIEKNRPAWQAGKLNGIGGLVEKGESPDDAMVREFEEEAGAVVKNWERVAVLQCPEAIVFFYRAFDDEAFLSLETKTDERVVMRTVSSLATAPTIPNLQWLVPLAANPCVRLPLQLIGAGTPPEVKR